MLTKKINNERGVCFYVPNVPGLSRSTPIFIVFRLGQSGAENRKCGPGSPCYGARSADKQRWKGVGISYVNTR